MSRKRKRSRKPPGRGIYILPNLCTTASLFAGFYSMISAVNGDFVGAGVAILISGVFDFMDGKVARMTRTTSQFGLEYDSLSDLVAFGAAPALLVYLWALQPFGRLGWVAGFLFLACGALRLARFNVHALTRDGGHFQGLPIPAAAAMIATTVFLFNYLGHSGPIRNHAVLFLIFALSFLMVSNFRFFSLKKTELVKTKPFNTLVGAVLVLGLVAVRPQVVLFFFGLCYVVSGPAVTLYRVHKLHQARKSGQELELKPQSQD